MVNDPKHKDKARLRGKVHRLGDVVVGKLHFIFSIENTFIVDYVVGGSHLVWYTVKSFCGNKKLVKCES